MKKLITLLLLVVSNLSFGQWGFVSSSQTFSVSNDELSIYQYIEFNFGGGNQSCPIPDSHAFIISNDTINLSITYTIPEVSPSFWCDRIDTFTFLIPEGTYNLSTCINLIGININTQIIDTVFNVDCDTTSNIVLGTEELSFLENSISIFPNPVLTNLSITTKNGVSIKRIKLYDLQGREIVLNTTSFYQIDVSNLPTGNYFLEIETDKGVLRKKLMID